MGVSCCGPVVETSGEKGLVVVVVAVGLGIVGVVGVGVCCVKADFLLSTNL
jgi:hypothetical protein